MHLTAILSTFWHCLFRGICSVFAKFFYCIPFGRNSGRDGHFPFYILLSSTGRIKWVRSLHSHLEDLVIEASSHPVLKTLPAASELLRHYSIVGTALVNYEADMKETWMKQNVNLHC
jgi:hypothetical protein